MQLILHALTRKGFSNDTVKQHSTEEQEVYVDYYFDALDYFFETKGERIDKGDVQDIQVDYIFDTKGEKQDAQVKLETLQVTSWLFKLHANN